MGKKSTASWCRFFRPFTFQHKVLMTLYMILTGLACYCYYLTLQEIDIEELRQSVAYFASLYLVNAVLVLGVAVATAKSFHPRLRLLNWSLQATCLGITLCADLGTDLKNHGQYNLIAYLLLWVPLGVLFACVKLGAAVKRLVNNDKR